jgi:hypothetical protein
MLQIQAEGIPIMSGLTKKYLAKIARVIHDVPEMNTRSYLCEKFGEMCARENPSFDWDKFERACGVRTQE